MKHGEFKNAPKSVSSYSTAVVVEPGPLMFVSGQLAIDKEGNPVGGDSMEAQARQIFENLKAICEESGVGMDRIVKMNYYVADLDRFDEVRRVREEYLSAPYPAATAVGARMLGGFLLEVEAVVALGG